MQCGDGSFYTGMATDIGRRVAAHQKGQGARYTRGRGPLFLWWSAGPYERAQAMAEERRIKALTHAQKEALGREYR